MTVHGEEGAPAPQSPDSVFGVLGDATRIGILQALWDRYDPNATDNAVTFSELFDRVDVTDTGNFNYHLGRLTGHFVRRTDVGYELAAPGFKIVRAVVAGGVTGDPTLASSPVDATCPRCDGPMALRYEDGTTWVRCTACEGYWPQRGGELLGFSLPPQGLRGRDLDEVLDATIVYSIHRFETMTHGVCPECGGSVDASLSVCAEHDAADGVCDACGSSFLGVVRLVCASCKFDWRSPSYAVVSDHPALVAFYYDHGVEHVPATWAAITRGLHWREALVSTDPASLRVTVRHAGERLDFLLDETATVVDVSD
ncbi:winged helix-turn-helix domain-containing protein [Salinigranum halophilum]|jgi:hypothetical protein|uniref:winged helix-turn-helix domain-containing protein n=1 Tax=Salinigranum halophilum TaxID=2565931 RepID=UPI0010A816B4|nr:helix-turn-helix domain-containing protein [Salinigranum halophilum]